MTMFQTKLSVLPLCESLQAQFHSPPGSSLGVVPDFITSFHLSPLRNWKILLLLFGQELLDSQSREKTWRGAKSGVQRTMAEEREERYLTF